MLLLLVAGGTGGHVFPAVAVAQTVKKSLEQHRCVLLTDERGKRFVSEEDFDEILILPSSLVSQLRFTNDLYPRLRPTCAVGFGGRNSFIPLLMAKFHRIKCAIHQSDCVMGKANAWLAPIVDKVFTSFAKTHPKEQVIGTPVRRGFHQVAKLESIDFPLQLAVLGGSQSASFWSTLLPKALHHMKPEDRQHLSIHHHCPVQDMQALEKAYKETNVCFRLFSFEQNMPGFLSTVHLVLTRAGASTISELQACGRPALFVPYPNATKNHQHCNAVNVTKSGGGWIIPQEDLTPERLAEFLSFSMNHAHLLIHAGLEMRQMYHPNASEALLSWCFSPFNLS